MIFRRFFSAQSDGDICTLYSDRTLINRRNVVSDPRTAYAADRDFLLLELEARIIVAAIKVLGFNCASGPPSNCPIPEELAMQSKLKKIQYLHKAASMVVDQIVFTKEDINVVVDNILTAEDRENATNSQNLNPNGRFPCRFAGCTRSFKYDGRSRRNHELTHQPPPEVDLQLVPCPGKPEKIKPKETALKDDIYDYNSALLSDGMLFLNFLDAVKEGDGSRIMRQYKYFMLWCKADKSHSIKYALECLYQMFLINSLLSPRDAHRYIWNRGVNNHGSPGKNIPLDLEVEHSNNHVKQAIKNLGPNVSEISVNRICYAEKSTKSIIHNMEKCVDKGYKFGAHTKKDTNQDLQAVVKRLCEVDVFERQYGRSLNHFSKFERSPILQLDMSMIYKWINDHKRNIDLKLKAR